ncbi:hypothetical protein SARC_07141 [Sphaeroforma arctica JP610]|uniref:RING-type domain-containing protein n=1 Tax=Sphaeroforma arctica JP610 TaxID=667725 RepID=A0A0L0FV36_9EUKA|nr:hypothetical protein SARC_07141 [Sphaeroforma arctica JP610]KNC80499.1 hypothetical protein SARC_07141 [Sphaeroforma arctica JP610]|eukprot:XP_014154401.1 hypothetical protein SARC_07141 [Sphaeroforma arctica JP610]
MCLFHWVYTCCCESEDERNFEARNSARHRYRRHNHERSGLLRHHGENAGHAHQQTQPDAHMETIGQGRNYLSGRELGQFQDATLTEAQLMRNVQLLCMREPLLQNQTKWGSISHISGSEPATELECAICLEPYQKNDVIQYLPCFHYFHADCIDNWFSKSLTCPLCLIELSPSMMLNPNIPS